MEGCCVALLLFRFAALYFIELIKTRVVTVTVTVSSAIQYGSRCYAWSRRRIDVMYEYILYSSMFIRKYYSDSRNV